MRIIQPRKISPKENSPLCFRGERGEHLQISILDEDLIRVQHRPDGVWRLDRSWMVGRDIPREGRHRDDLADFSQPAYSFSGGVVRTKLLQVEIQQEPFALTWSDAQGHVFAKDLPQRAYSYDSAGRAVWHYLQIEDESERYYGFGERSGPLNKAGRRMRMHNLDALGYDAENGDPLYKHFPLYITYLPERQLAYALIYDNLSSCVFDLGLERDAYHGRYRYYQAEDGDLDYYLVYGPSFERVVARITELTGRMMMPPRWSLGYLGSTMSYTEAPDSQAQLAKFVDLCREHQIPCDLFHLSSGFTLDAQNRRNVFTWNRSRVPQPEKMVERFHAAGQKVAANIKPCLLTSHPMYEQMKERGAFLGSHPSVFWGGLGSYLDFTNPQTYAWWQSQVQEQILDYGIDSTWNDNNEYEIWDDETPCQGFGKAFSIGMARPLQTLLMMRASFEAQRAHQPDLRPFLISRAGCPGMQRYAQTWSGDNSTDWRTLRWNIPMGLGLSLSGVPSCGHDVGGFAGPAPTPELLVRWVQNGIFHPRFCIHSWNSDGTVNEPWMYPEVLPILRHWIEFRYRLIPYFYSLLDEAVRRGTPLLRPLVYVFPEDPRCWDESFDFMLGPALLVASVLEEGATTRSVYLPSGSDWFDFFSGQHYPGGQIITVAAPLDSVPLFARAGSIVPLGRPLLHVGAEPDNFRELLLFPAPASEAESFFDLREDDGVSAHGAVTWLTLRLKSSAQEIGLSVDRTGDYPLAYNQLEIVLPPGEERAWRGAGRETRVLGQRKILLDLSS